MRTAGGFSAGGLSSLLAADTPGVIGFVGLDPFDRTMTGEAERLGLAAAGRLQTEAMLQRAPSHSVARQKLPSGSTTRYV